MDIYNYVIDDTKEIPHYFDFDKESICFIDIETTGLNKSNNFIYLLGMLYFDQNSSSWNITQYFIDNLKEEKDLLHQFNDMIKKFKIIITFNGESFDIPFIKHRMSKYMKSNNIDNLLSFDIYKKLKEERPFLNLKNYKLKTIEETLGIYRDDIISGKECINLYYKYVKTKDKSLIDDILKHNHDDLYYLIDILKIFNIIHDSKTFYIQKSQDLIKIEIVSISCDGDMFNISCKTSKSNNIAYFGEHFNIRWDNKNLFIDFEYKKGLITPTKKCLFADVSSWNINNKLKDSSEYIVPNNIMLLKVEDKYEMDNLKKIVKESILTI